MKKSTQTSGPVVPITTAIATGTVAAATAIMCPPLFPFSFLSAILFYKLGQAGTSQEIDEIAAGDAHDLAEEWRRNRRPGEKSIEVSKTIYSGGALFDLPMTRTYRYELEPHELGASPALAPALPDYSKLLESPMPLWDDRDYGVDTLNPQFDAAKYRPSDYGLGRQSAFKLPGIDTSKSSIKPFYLQDVLDSGGFNHGNQ